MPTNFYLVLSAIVGLIVSAQTTLAQTYQPSNRSPVADNTLGTQVSGANNNFNITGGLNKGQTLFHSFTDFSVPMNGQANFARSAGNRDTIARVTGGRFSDINGLVNTNGANFFLINPQGVVFGPNAKLNVGRSFVTTTANGIDLVDAAGKTYNFGVNGAGDAPLITVNPNVFFNPSKLIMGGNNSGSSGIFNYGTLQTDNQGQYIGLIGGNITMNGGAIVAPGGRVDLGGLNSAGTIAIDSKGLVFGGNSLIRSDISLTNGSQITVRAKETLSTVNPFFNNAISQGSSININANNVRLTNDRSIDTPTPSSLDAGLAQDSGVKTGSGGDVQIDSTGDVTLGNGSFIRNTILPNATGQIGNINIKAKNLRLTDLSLIRAATAIFGKGNAGNININIFDGDLSLSGNSDIQAGVAGIGNGGDISITTTGNISLDTNNPDPNILRSRILTNTNGQGDSGKITIDSKGDILLSNSEILAGINEAGKGNSKGIDIKARNVSLSNDSRITADNFGKGNAGNIDIITKGDLTISGTDDKSLLQPNLMSLSTISAQTTGEGDSGKISIDTKGDLSISNRSALLGGISGPGIGNAKEIEIRANNLKLTNLSNIFSGNINEDGTISTNLNTASGGNIAITLNGLLLLRNNVDISTSSYNIGKNSSGGNITINSPLIVATPGNNDITANAKGGNGGKIDITSQGLFGIQYRPIGADVTNDITATSTFGLSGTVNINAPGTDPAKDNGELSEAPNDVSNQIAQACGASQRDNKFYITGRGGLPPNASDPQESDALWTDPREVKTKPATTANLPRKYPPPAIGWVREKNGRVRLIAAQTAIGATEIKAVCPNK